MYRIRFHGRGGQGMKTASRILGTAFFLAGYEVQDAPRYGAERRGAPIFAFVRADSKPINERGIITHPDLVIVADDTLLGVPAAGVLMGIDAHCVLLIDSRESTDSWRNRLNLEARVVALPAVEESEDRAEQRYISAACAGAATRLLGFIDLDILLQAVEQELEQLGEEIVQHNLRVAGDAYKQMAEYTGLVTPAEQLPADSWPAPDWIELEFEAVPLSAPVIHGPDTSEMMQTGLWRTMRPEVDYDLCKGCWWICSTFCPDSAIGVDEGLPKIDYEHCKGCLVCVAQCPSHAIAAIPEYQAQEAER